MVEQKNLANLDVSKILSLVESHFLDFKRIEIGVVKLTETISAFANTAGGEIYVGIGETEDKSKTVWNGFDRPENANGIFQVLTKMTALGNHYSASFLNCADLPGYVLHLTILKTKDILPSHDGKIFVRRNAQNLRLVSPEEIERLRLDKGITTFEDESVNVSHDVITNSETAIAFVLGVIPNVEPIDWMKKQNLISDSRPSVAGVLLFSDEPQAALPKRAAIKIYRYKTREQEGSRDQLVFDPLTVEGCLYNLIEEAVTKTKSLVEEIKILGAVGLETVRYPHETLHEILTNAVLHRDYSIPTDIHVRIYENRIEVESPGRLAGHVTTQNLLTEQFARNPKIVRLINKFPNPPNKDVGEGLNTAFEAMKKLKLKVPEIEEGINSVVVHIRHSPLASPQDAVMTYLTDHDEITNKIAREVTGITSENVVKDVFLSLSRRKMLERVPGKRGNASAWRKWTGQLDQTTLDNLLN